MKHASKRNRGRTHVNRLFGVLALLLLCQFLAPKGWTLMGFEEMSGLETLVGLWLVCVAIYFSLPDKPPPTINRKAVH